MLRGILSNVIGFVGTAAFIWWLWSRRSDRRRFPPEEEQ